MNRIWKITALPLALTAVLCCFSCNRESEERENIPLIIEAEIASSQISRVATSDFERSDAFLEKDKIRITAFKGATSIQTADYIKGPQAWSVSPVDATGLILTPNVVYEARFPVDYSAIKQDQSTKSAYIASDLLQTPQIASGSGGVLAFVDNAKFVHKNVKISLVFQVPSESTPLTEPMTFRLSGAGLRTGGTNNESLVLFRPDDSVLAWCGIAFAQGEEKIITVVLTSNKVDYKAELKCSFISGTHYKYTLTVHNNLLIPQGAEIAAWKDNAAYSGDFNKK